jgi:phage terminase large subunit-like protein
VLRWMMDNIYIRTDPAGNIKADKEKSTEKIDGAIAAIMALDRAIRWGTTMPLLSTIREASCLFSENAVLV